MSKQITLTPRSRILCASGSLLASALLVCTLGMAGCASGTSSSASSAASSTTAAHTVNSGDVVHATTSGKYLSKDDITINETIENSADGEHAIAADGQNSSYANTLVKKTGESSGDEADFYGENAAVFATNGATLDLSNMVVETNGTHANGVFSYGEGTTVNISDSVIETSGNCSGGIMTTGGGTMNANNLTIHTTGNSSAAIRSDRGGGTVTVTNGSYTTDGKGSPAIYSTAGITVNDALLTSTSSQGVVVEGKNSVTLNDVELVASNTSKNSDKSNYYQAVMIYQSMSGDAANGEASFTANGGSIANANGDIFFVNNTVATINLKNVAITNSDASGVFLRAAAAGWGNEGSNGGQVTLKAQAQEINGNMLVDGVSNLNLYLADGSTFNGTINPDGSEGDVYVEISGGSKWVLTGDAYVKSLTCDADSIDLNGHTLYVDGQAYEAGTASTGSAIAVVVSESSHGGPGGNAPSGGAPSGGSSQGPGGSSGGTPPDKPKN